MKIPDTLRPLQVYALEVHAVQHCNLSCVGCAQSSPGQLRGYEDPEILEHTLGNLSGHLSCRKLQVLGGEPMLHPRIDDILLVAARSGLAGKITVKTNGLLLHRASPRFWTLADEVIVSVYPATKRAIDPKRVQLQLTASSHGTALVFRKYDRFQKILVSSADREVGIEDIYDRCEFKVFTHSVRDGRIYRCAPSVNLARGRADPEDTDSLDAMNPYELRARLDDFLSSRYPLRSCSSCMGSQGASFPHTIDRARPTRAL